MKNQKIAIAGGTGKFGQHLGERMESSNQIMISGSTVEKAEKIADKKEWLHGENQELGSWADTVIVAVPISVTSDVINQIGPYLDDETLFCDITSVKQRPVEEMKKYSGQVLGMHPMYAPSNSIKGQKVILTPEKGEKWTEMRDFWGSHGADIHVTDPETHDKAMSLVQGLMHFSELVVADVIRKSDLSSTDMEEFSSPVYRLITDLTARMLNQKPGLYRSIQVENPENKEIREEFVESAESIRGLIQDRKEFQGLFEELGSEFDLEGAQGRTDRIIEFMSEM